MDVPDGIMWAVFDLQSGILFHRRRPCPDPVGKPVATRQERAALFGVRRTAIFMRGGESWTGPMEVKER